MGYFDKWPVEKVEGIEGVKMNAPLFPGKKPQGNVGIELEIEASNNMPDSADILVRDPVTKAYWLAKQDGSLRNGMEYVSSIPFDINSVSEMVDGFFDALKGYSTKLKLSNRCSTHVHLNVADWKIDKVTSLIVLWTLFETPLIEWCGVNRKANHFCLSTTECDDLISNWNAFLKGHGRDFTEGSKYTAMNLLPLWTQGSIEIRTGREPGCPNDVTPWVQFLWALREYAGNIASPSMIPILVSGDGPTGLFSEICETAGLTAFKEEVLSETPDFDEVCYKTFRDVQKLCYFPWDEWLPLINREYYRDPFTTPMPHVEQAPAPRPGRLIMRGGEGRIRHEDRPVDWAAIDEILDRN